MKTKNLLHLGLGFLLPLLVSPLALAAPTKINPTQLQTQPTLTAGSYTNANVTVTAQGIVTAASNGTAGSSGSVVSVSPVSGYQALLLVSPSYQTAPGSASFVSAPLVTDKTSGDTTTGYIGASFAAGKPGTIAFQSGNSIASSIIAAWPFYEGSGTIVHDVSGNGLNYTSAGSTAPTWATGPNGAILNFISGNSSNLSIADNTLLKPTSGFSFSVYGLFPTAQPTGNPRPLRKQSSAGNYFGVASTGTISQSSSGTAYSYSGAVSSYSGAYHLYTETINPSTNTATYYVDGGVIGTTTGSGTLTWDTATQYAMGSPGGSDYAAGSLDVMYEWSRALSAAEVASLAANPYQLIGTSYGGTQITALLDIGTLGTLPITTVKFTRSWVQALTEVLEYSSNGTTWTAIPTGYTPPSHAGTAASVQTTVTLSSTINARYLRYSAKDSGANAQLILTDFGVS